MFAAVVLSLLASAPKVHVHPSGEAGFFANAYLVESDQGVVAVDAPFTVSEALAFRKELDALHKPLLGVLVTHAHPDHVNGIGALVAGTKVPVYALQGVAQTLKAIDGPKRAYWAPIYKSEYPTQTTFPDQLLRDGDRVQLGGMTFTAHDLGSGESADETAWVLEGQKPVAFVGDLVMAHVHAWVAEGRTGAWLEALTRADRTLAAVATVYPGHGPSGTRALLGWEKRYLTAYRENVHRLANGAPALSAEAKTSLTSAMARFVPDGRLSALVAMGADAVATELSTSARR